MALKKWFRNMLCHEVRAGHFMAIFRISFVLNVTVICQMQKLWHASFQKAHRSFLLQDVN